MKIIEGVIRAENPTELLSPALSAVWMRALTYDSRGYQRLRTVLCGHMIGGMLIEANREHPENATLSIRTVRARMALLGPKQLDAFNHYLNDWNDGNPHPDHPAFYAIEQDTLRPLKGFVGRAEKLSKAMHDTMGSITGLASFVESREAVSHHMVETIAELVLCEIHSLRQGALFCSTVYRHMIGQEWILLNDLAAEFDISTSRVSESLAGAIESGFVRHRRNALNTRMTEIRFEWPDEAGRDHMETIRRRNNELHVRADTRPDKAFDLLPYQPISASTMKLSSLTTRNKPLNLLGNR